MAGPQTHLAMRIRIENRYLPSLFIQKPSMEMSTIKVDGK